MLLLGPQPVLWAIGVLEGQSSPRVCSGRVFCSEGGWTAGREPFGRHSKDKYAAPLPAELLGSRGSKFVVGWAVRGRGCPFQFRKAGRQTPDFQGFGRTLFEAKVWPGGSEPSGISVSQPFGLCMCRRAGPSNQYVFRVSSGVPGFPYTSLECRVVAVLHTPTGGRRKRAVMLVYGREAKSGAGVGTGTRDPD